MTGPEAVLPRAGWPHTAPSPDEDSAFYWSALNDGRIRLQRCESCNRLRFPPTPACPFCGGDQISLEDVSGCGRIYSWIIVNQPVATVRPDDIPLTIATVELEDGVRLVGRIVGGKPVQADAAVEPRFYRHDGWTELAFVVRREESDAV